MVPVLAAVVIGAAVGAARRPLGTHLETPALRLVRLAVAGVALQAVGSLIGLPLPGLILFASLTCLAVFGLWNRHLVGMGVLSIGIALNALAVLVHGAMPVRATALLRAGAAPVGGLADVDLGFGRRFERTGDLAPWLGDALPVGLFDTVMSFGDLIALAGIASLAGELARYARRGTNGSLATIAAKLVHDWGLAPRPAPESGFQYSAQSDATAPATSEPASEPASDVATDRALDPDFDDPDADDADPDVDDVVIDIDSPNDALVAASHAR